MSGLVRCIFSAFLTSSLGRQVLPAKFGLASCVSLETSFLLKFLFAFCWHQATESRLCIHLTVGHCGLLVLSFELSWQEILGRKFETNSSHVVLALPILQAIYDLHLNAYPQSAADPVAVFFVMPTNTSHCSISLARFVLWITTLIKHILQENRIQIFCQRSPNILSKFIYIYIYPNKFRQIYAPTKPHQ